MSIAAIAKLFKLTASQVSYRLRVYETDWAAYKAGYARMHPEKVRDLGWVTEQATLDEMATMTKPQRAAAVA